VITYPNDKFAIGRRWYCSNTYRDAFGLIPFYFIILDYGPTPDSKLCSLKFEVDCLRDQGLDSFRLKYRLQLLGHKSKGVYTHDHLLRVATPIPIPWEQMKRLPCHGNFLGGYFYHFILHPLFHPEETLLPFSG